MKFGVRECADVVLRAKSAQKIGNKIFYKNEPVCYFDTLKTSTFEGAATTVYAQGGRGNARLMSWDGERTVTFTMEDALISPAGLAILTGAGLIDATEQSVIQHVTETTDLFVRDGNGEGNIGTIYLKQRPYIKNSTDNFIYVMGLNDNGEVITEPYYFTCANPSSDTEDPAADQGLSSYDIGGKTGTGYIITIKGVANNYSNDAESPADLPKLSSAKVTAVLVDYYVRHTKSAMQIDITPDKFGGTFYLEASTLWRDQSSGEDKAAEFIIPSCKVQSNFSFTLASSGDPSSFTFTMDAFPDYTRWDRTKKVLASIQVIGTSENETEELTRRATYSQDTAEPKTGRIIAQTGGTGT